jgi:hypothetical protein
MQVTLGTPVRITDQWTIQYQQYLKLGTKQNRGRPVIIKHILTGETIIFKTARAANAHFGFKNNCAISVFSTVIGGC